MELSDTDLGRLGNAFILLYAVVGLPLGRLADRWNRRWLLAVGVALWSVTTILSGFATGFWSLVVLRFGVGIGEATCAPTASSLIGDLVPAQRRARAMSIFMLGLPLGLALSSFVSGAVAQYHGWQSAFFVAGVPGLLLAFAALFILDPPRGAADPHSPPPTERLPFTVVARRVRKMPTMWWIIISGALHNFNMYALGTFLASFLILPRTQHRAGYVTGLILGFARLGFSPRAGWAIVRFVADQPVGCTWPGSGWRPQFPVFSSRSRAASCRLCVAGLLPEYLLLYTYYGTVYATIQDVVRPASRRGDGDLLLPCICSAEYSARKQRLGQRLVCAIRGYHRIEADRTHKAVGLHHALYLVPILTACWSRCSSRPRRRGGISSEGTRRPQDNRKRVSVLPSVRW